MVGWYGGTINNATAFVAVMRQCSAIETEDNCLTVAISTSHFGSKDKGKYSDSSSNDMEHSIGDGIQALNDENSSGIDMDVYVTYEFLLLKGNRQNGKSPTTNDPSLSQPLLEGHPTSTETVKIIADTFDLLFWQPRMSYAP